MSDVVLGLDLSLSGLGMCAVPAAWDLRRELVRAKTLAMALPMGASNRDHTRRYAALARDVRTWAIYVGATHVWIEDVQHFPRKRMRQGIQLVELRAAVRLELEWECGLDVEFVAAREARTLLYGRDVPRGLDEATRKAWLFEPLKLCGLPLDDHNQGDAFAVANYGLSELGAPCLAGLCAPAGKASGREVCV